MRLTVTRLRRVVKADLPIEFVPQHLTSYGGLGCCAGTSACSGLRRSREGDHLGLAGVTQGRNAD